MALLLEKRSPSELGYSLVAEWAPHEQSWIAWPCRRDLWRARLDRGRAATAVLARCLARYEPVVMLANSEDAVDASIACGEGIEVLPVALDDSWVRDTGPVFLSNGRGIAGLDMPFNGWGGKYQPYADDSKLAAVILERLSMTAFEAPFVLECGALCGDGEGTLLVTEQCALNRNRNPGATIESMTSDLCRYLGVTAVIWLEGGSPQDETEGHIDNVARFVAPGRVLALDPETADDSARPVLIENLCRLRDSTDASARTIEVDLIPVPRPRRVEGRLLTQSYLNFCFVNGAVLVPLFDDPADDTALAAFGRCFPNRIIEAVPAVDLAYGGGALHCATLDQPTVPG